MSFENVYVEKYCFKKQIYGKLISNIEFYYVALSMNFQVISSNRILCLHTYSDRIQKSKTSAKMHNVYVYVTNFQGM
jgi:hypothetical protein